MPLSAGLRYVDNAPAEGIADELVCYTVLIHSHVHVRYEDSYQTLQVGMVCISGEGGIVQE